MSYCINLNSFDNKNVSVGKTTDYKTFSGIYKMNKLYYKYDHNLSKELKLLTGFINIKSVKYIYGNIVFYVESPELKNILKHIESIIPAENKIVKTVENVKKNVPILSNSESESDSEEEKPKKKVTKKIVIEYLDSEAEEAEEAEEEEEEDNNQEDNNQEDNNQEDNNQEDNSVRIYFKNEKSELKLNPTKKSNLDTYILTKNENYNQIKNYYPYINKYNITGNITGNFILYLSVVNGKIKFNIKSGELKHPMSFTKRDITVKNVYDTKVVIDI